MHQNKISSPWKEHEKVNKSRMFYKTAGMSNKKVSIEASTHMGAFYAPYLYSNRSLLDNEKCILTSRIERLFTIFAKTGKDHKPRDTPPWYWTVYYMSIDIGTRDGYR